MITLFFSNLVVKIQCGPVHLQNIFPNPVYSETTILFQNPSESGWTQMWIGSRSDLCTSSINSF